VHVQDLESRLLLGPGPSPVAPRVLGAMSHATLGHLDPQFLALMDDVNARLRGVFGTENTMTFPVSGTGSAAMEASMANMVEPGDKVIVGVNGVFGGRLVEMARRMRGEVVEVHADWGRIIEPDQIADALKAHPDSSVVAVVAAETSTGAWQPLGEIGRMVREHGALFVADTVTALGGTPVEVDANHVDVAYSGTQKCLGVPPGLAPITFSERALEKVKSRSTPVQSWYLDVGLLAGYLGSERRYHHTAPINMMYALHEGLVALEEEGLEARYRRHAAVGGRLQDALEIRGFCMFAQEGHRLPQLTAAALPEGREEGPLRRRLLEEHGIEVGGGLGPAKGKLWRIGLMGFGASDENVDRLLDAIDRVMA
jgi:alanine-glyoxylate transaminase/serine-glyoxylate transaminase/serine-pyruvate transaminase